MLNRPLGELESVVLTFSRCAHAHSARSYPPFTVPAKLRLALLVLPRKQGIQVFYRVANDHVRQLVADAIHHAEDAGPGVPAHHRDEAVDVKEAR